jgi:hypothetical protein
VLEPWLPVDSFEEAKATLSADRGVIRGRA